MAETRWLSAAEAARRLGVKRETLYAYVSRGLIRSAATGGKSRARRYARDDVERARRRGEDRRDPSSSAAHALSLGHPVLESSITCIKDGQLYYRGQPVIELARSRSIPEVASLIWARQFDAWPRGALHRGSRITALSKLSFIARAQALIAAAADDDPRAFNLGPDAVAVTGARILDLMTVAATGVSSSGDDTIESRLANGWRLRGGAADLLRTAIILCADHELNVSSFTARCIASAGGTPYGSVIGGLAALEGTRHGGVTIRVESMLDSMRRSRSGRDALAARLREGVAIDGFGHPLYPDGDPRAKEIMAQIAQRYPRSPELRFALEVATAALSMLEVHPSLDFALATLARVLRLPRGAGLTLFAIGRVIGWIGHAMEQWATGELIRPRAKYVGLLPTP